MPFPRRVHEDHEPRPAATRWMLLNGAAGLLTLALTACDRQSLPTAPSAITAGLTIYEHANYLGDSALLTRSIGDLGDFKGPCVHSDSDGTTTIDWEDCVSAVRIAPGWRATLYRDGNFKGESVEVAGDLSNLQLVAGSCNHDGMNDCVSSIMVVPPALADAGPRFLALRRGDQAASRHRGTAVSVSPGT